MPSSSVYLVTGGAGFIGSHIVERLLARGHRVRVLDNFSTGSRANLAFGKDNRRLEVIRGDLKGLATVERALRGVTAVFHQAAMRSVPRSVADPLGANASNVTGTLHVLVAEDTPVNQRLAQRLLELRVHREARLLGHRLPALGLVEFGFAVLIVRLTAHATSLPVMAWDR